MGLAINVAFQGSHLFTTDPSNLSGSKAVKAFNEIYNRFPASAGFDVTASEVAVMGCDVTKALLSGEYGS